MKLPEFTPVTDAMIQAIVDRHHLRVDAIQAIPPTGIINAIYFLGDDYVLRVPRDHPAHVAQARREIIAIPAARLAGVQTPQLIAFDDTLDLLPVPYLITERVHAATLGMLTGDPVSANAAWREVGRNLAKLHLGVPDDGPAGLLALDARPARSDPRRLVDARARDGWFSTVEATWLIRWLDRLAPFNQGATRKRLIHGDVQSTNVLVDAQTRDFRALIDWGCVGWDDPAQDFKGMPIRAVPAILVGYREIGRVDSDDSAEARILWATIDLILQFMPRGAAPGLAWGEQPLAMLLDLFRFFLSRPGAAWDDLAPP